MDHHRRDSDSSDDSCASDHSADHPPSFNRNLNLELKRSTEELNSEFDRNTLDDKIKKLDDTIDELESMHKKTIVGSLVGSSVGAAGGIAAIAGVCLAPFTFGASLALTVGGAVAGVAGGVAGGASNITNMVRQKTLREKIEKIIHEVKTTIKPMGKLLNEIYDITEDIKLEVKTLNKLDIQRSARGAEDVLKIARVAEIGKVCAEAAKEICVFVKVAKAVRVSASAVNAARVSASAVNAARVSASAAKSIRVAAAFTGVLSALFLAVDVYSIVKDSKEISEMNQPADKKKEEEISSETLKFILQMKAAADQFKKIVKIITDAIVTFI